jgi:hypothetical protein
VILGRIRRYKRAAPLALKKGKASYEQYSPAGNSEEVIVYPKCTNRLKAELRAAFG